MKISPLKVVVKPCPKIDKHTNSGILTLSQFDDLQDNFGEVVAVGDGICDEDMPYKVGDKVKFNAFSCYDFVGGNLIMNYTDVYCKIKS